MQRAAEIAAIGTACRQALEEKHQAREVVLSASRRAIQSSAASIRATHRGEFELATRPRDRSPRAQIAQADAALATAARSAGQRSGARRAQRGRRRRGSRSRSCAATRCPAPTSSVSTPSAYLNGMAEAASELRRQVLDCLRRGELERGETLMAAMDDVYSVLVTIDYPDVVTGGLRRTTDALRAVLERTRGDLTTTIVAARLQASIDAGRRGPQTTGLKPVRRRRALLASTGSGGCSSAR